MKKKKLVKTWRNTRIPCICQVRTAIMEFEGVDIGELAEERNDAGEFDWVIRPYWDNLKKVSPINIPGIDMDLHLDEYIRAYLPVIVEQRTLSDSRGDLQDELRRLGMTYNDRFEFMIRNRGLCGNNRITMRRKESEIGTDTHFDSSYRGETQ